MELLFIGVACTDDAIKQSNEKYYNNNATVRPQQYFDLNLIRGLSEYCNVEAITEPPVASFPKSRCILYKRKRDIISSKLSITYISLFNILGLKTIIIMLTILIKSFVFCLKNKGKEQAILLGYSSFFTSFPAMIVARVFKIKVFVMVPDIPKYLVNYSNNNSRIRRYLSIIALGLDKYTQSNFDGYVLLTKYMNELINTNQKPYIIMEGFINKDEISLFDISPKETGKIIMYAGTLHQRFGIKRLVEAFKLLSSDEYELWIYGEGDYLPDITEASKMNSNIKYKGVASKEEVIRIEQIVTLLVNPRPSDEEFTKYSFPSKTTEYMASGTPLLTTRLAGIPEEYFNYVFTFESEDIIDFAKKLEQVLALPQDVLNDYGMKAKEFVIDKKNHIIQTKKIYEFIKTYI